MASATTNKKSHFTTFIVVSLVAGLVAGVFFGDYAAPLKILGDAYVGLLQMTVLPYILFSLIANIGRLNNSQAGLLARTGLTTLFCLWLVAGLVVVAMALALPFIPSGSFFSTSLIAPPPNIDFLGLFIPTNLFQSLSSNAVPAVVLFCLLFGTALMGFDDKKTLLDQLDLISRVLQKVNSMVVKLTPLGIFAITASAAGTLSLDEFGRIQAYLLTLTVAVLLLTLWVYPLLICSCTTLRWRQVVLASRDALITAFVLGSIFAVIPILVHSVEKMLENISEGDDEVRHLPQLMLPLAYPFPDGGKILTLLFIPFAGWFYGTPMSAEDMVTLLTVGPVVLFGKVVTAVPFLLNLFEIPTDIFQLFLASGVLMGRLADVVGAMHLITFTLLTSAVMGGYFQWRWKLLLRRLVLVSVVASVVVLGMNSLLYKSYKGAYDKGPIVMAMQAMETDVPITVFTVGEPNPVPLQAGQSHADRITERGVLRVGFTVDNLPFTFFNGQDQLVGFDVDLMQALASDLDVGLEFVPYEIEQLSQDLLDDHFDIAVSGITATASRSGETLFSDPYLFVNMGMVVQDFRKREFSSQASIRGNKELRVGVRSGSNFIARAKAHFPSIEIVALVSEIDFFTAADGQFDALLTTAEGGAAWTLLYPGYTVINPLDVAEQAPLVIAIPPEMDMEEYLEMWIILRRLDGTLNRLFDYWIRGEVKNAGAPRWSVMRDVLHWVD
jgi:Na+/H+-dicarboxylate symporter/ABC-type amino acid transport substrate-binding protein